MGDNLTTIETQRGTDYALDVARDDLFKVRAALKARDARIAELEGMVCRLTEHGRDYMKLIEERNIYFVAYDSPEAEIIVGFRNALQDSAPCPHAAEVERMKEELAIYRGMPDARLHAYVQDELARRAARRK